MERSYWFTFTNDILIIAQRDRNSFVEDLCLEIQDKLESLEREGLLLLMGDNLDEYISLIWGDLFKMNFGNGLKFKMDPNISKEQNLKEISVTKILITLLVLNDALWLCEIIQDRNTDKNFKRLENRAYNISDKENLIETSRGIGRMIINDELNPRFGKLKNHIKVQLEYLNNCDTLLLNDKQTNDQDKPLKKTMPKYCEIGSLFAQGFIHRNGFNVYYKDTEFESVNQLSIHLQSNVLKIKTAVRQYINDTVTGANDKNFYTSKTMMKNIMLYCEQKKLNITDSFKAKYEELNDLH